MAIEATREVLRVTQIEAFQKDTVNILHGPKSLSDEDIWDYWRSTASTTWHTTGTIKMGKKGDEDAYIDNDFRVIGTKGLRVVDMSVMRISPKCSH